MGYSMTDEELAYIYWTLSDAFVDTAVDYKAIPCKTEDYDHGEIKRILYHEVATMRHTNLETAIANIWSAFNLENLKANIDKTLKARERRLLRRQKYKILTHWLEFRYKYIWIEILKHFKDPNHQTNL